MSKLRKDEDLPDKKEKSKMRSAYNKFCEKYKLKMYTWGTWIFGKKKK